MNAGTMEGSNYRYYRRMAWQVLRSRYAAEVAAETDAGVPTASARQRAARAVRGELRALMAELLTHAPVPAVIDFMTAARVWGPNGERLLEQVDLIGNLIESVEPTAPWPGPAPLEREAADDDANWSPWVEKWLAAFRLTGPAAVAVASPPETAPPGQVSKQRAWVPWAISAAAVVGSTVVVALTSRR